MCGRGGVPHACSAQVLLHTKIARDDRDMLCCASRDARAAYKEGGYGCARCLPLYEYARWCRLVETLTNRPARMRRSTSLPHARHGTGPAAISADMACAPRTSPFPSAEIGGWRCVLNVRYMRKSKCDVTGRKGIKTQSLHLHLQKSLNRPAVQCDPMLRLPHTAGRARHPVACEDGCGRCRAPCTRLAGATLAACEDEHNTRGSPR